MTKDYYGTKRITAWPEDRDGKPGYAVKYADGYISWSPADVFEAAYQPVTGMSFGHALQALKEGHRVARAGWNGKGMWVALTPGSSFAAACAKPGHAAFHRACEMEDQHQSVNLLPHLDMRAADGSMVIGWLASQTDMLADDWQIVEG
ncbi:DUF2829 domain-containing protein [Tritonibacter mobilis]|uniref:DUF2829 domain-containing protein n=1 Tax=Tritonibacter mobilis TaxID=379347 RepID=UPI000B566BFD|nr:DUF2829 domain-containing protein [Tritonibacter mobilis]ANH49101.1 hypothetical protein [Ruegeria phage 45A6]